MQLTSNSFSDGQKIPGDFAFCIPAPASHVCLGGNRNPQLAWCDIPAGTRSCVVICHDPDVPSRGDDVNQEGRSVPATLPRVDFFHWVLVDLSAGKTEIAAGEFSDGVTPRGKPGPAAAHGARQGINDFTAWFAGDHDMSGDYYGYDGPCPPWNDELRHRYVFTVFALDVERLPLEGKFTGQQVRAAMQGHILAQASLTGVYTLNPAVKL
ncbi:MAG: YbhB/YbcL family Raf kinase inhibitor-like protein [Rhodocyclaceae bacterium]|nr:YbhB/YbcL family Raf kinase inhibitor-like protein [Rhodocyclaceae bacterium]